MVHRVVVTGLGVCAPNGVGLSNFTRALKSGESGIRFQQELKDLNYACHIAGQPQINPDFLASYFTSLQLRDLRSTGIMYGVIAGTDAWEDAGLHKMTANDPDWDSGIVFGSGTLGVAAFREAIYKIDAGNTRRLGSSTVQQTMASGISAYLGGILGCGNQVTSNSSACATGTEAILMGYERIRSGKAKRMLTGSCSDSGPYVWSAFDALRILPGSYNEKPAKASRPMSATAAGFVPGSGAGALVLESLDSALMRGVPIYAEILGGAVNSGGQRGDGSMTAPNSVAVQHCIVQAVANAGIKKSDIDIINGHLTATAKDPLEIRNWSEALDVSPSHFPFINSFKGHFGHCLAAAGSIECVGAILQFKERMCFGNVNCEDPHPEILNFVEASKIPQRSFAFTPKILAKASFGFGDVNACIIFKNYNE
ncbi:beta-ketoacyl-[acyl-carrier-protein] synthase family protein [Arenibacter sp. GZD96]|uniref:beta-ketoacyl-[acyl-carrier-protein] synthase family protein n=1 Tax=Aurantibrevibacter litoralis TaxID=3106030 RepID=UPI002AFEA8C1|nr:beta-ketoacyl-[acyl-carrier-protein] synthase family protein [Arenibacter sp. GZD-96]MEA1786391.1 beta-ketoacyl-[acyl-carrier-protein] synthase family protein [Arenibacter sp. GZD-96]